MQPDDGQTPKSLSEMERAWRFKQTLFFLNPMQKDPSPNFDEHIKPIHPKGGILSAWAELPSPIADFRKKILFAQLNKIDEEIMDYLTSSHKNLETLNPVKMGKKKMQAEIERLKQVAERLEAEKAELKEKQLSFDLEAVKGILARHGKVGVTVNSKNPEFFRDLNSHRTFVITLNC
jgi:hypothetical protein